MDKGDNLQSSPTVTLRALKPYLLTYRLLGLVPAKFGKDVDCLYPAQWRRSTQSRVLRWDWYTIYSGVLFILMTLFLLNYIPLQSMVDPEEGNVADKLEAANQSSFCLNVFVIITICFAYLGRRLCRLVERMIRCERELFKLGCNSAQVGQLPYYCWTVFAIGIVATYLHELLLCTDKLQSFKSSESNRQLSDNVSSPEERPISSNHTFQGMYLFRLVFAPFAAGIRPFVDYSVVQFSLVLSWYQSLLRKEMEHWSSLGLKAKERLRLTYWTVQSLIKEADEIFSPAVLIGSLSCVGDLILHINIAFRKETDDHYQPVDDQRLHQVSLMNTCSTVYLALRFMASCFFAERINRERQKSLRGLQEQSNEEFWTYDLELLITKRFVQQLTLPMGFTGCGFFTLGKRYFIAMCGTILTYEIVLLDMAKSVSSHDEYNPTETNKSES